jgi:hypothetical protein
MQKHAKARKTAQMHAKLRKSTQSCNKAGESMGKHAKAHGSIFLDSLSNFFVSSNFIFQLIFQRFHFFNDLVSAAKICVHA